MGLLGRVVVRGAGPGKGPQRVLEQASEPRSGGYLASTAASRG